MKIDKLLKDAAIGLLSLANRFDIQANAKHYPDEKADCTEWAAECRTQAEALRVMAAAYAPILQSAIDTGMQGKTHKITVSERAESKLTGEEIFVMVSEHLFTVDTGKIIKPEEC